ncbi:hypothetical protein ACTXT7_010888 [Hymenolepis weldensis]
MVTPEMKFNASNITLLQNAIAAIKPITYSSISTATGAPPIGINATATTTAAGAEENSFENVPPAVPPVDSDNLS